MSKKSLQEWLEKLDIYKYDGETSHVSTNVLNVLKDKYTEIFDIISWGTNGNMYINVEDIGYTKFKPFNEHDLYNFESELGSFNVKNLRYVNERISWIINCLEGLLFPKVGIMKENKEFIHIYDFTEIKKFPFTSTHSHYCDFIFTKTSENEFIFDYEFSFDKFENIDIDCDDRYNPTGKSYAIFIYLIEELKSIYGKNEEFHNNDLYSIKQTIYTQYINRWLEIKFNDIFRNIIESKYKIEDKHVESVDFSILPTTVSNNDGTIDRKVKFIINLILMD